MNFTNLSLYLLTNLFQLWEGSATLVTTHTRLHYLVPKDVWSVSEIYAVCLSIAATSGESVRAAGNLASVKNVRWKRAKLIPITTIKYLAVMGQMIAAPWPHQQHGEAVFGRTIIACSSYESGVPASLVRSLWDLLVKVVMGKVWFEPNWSHDAAEICRKLWRNVS